MSCVRRKRRIGVYGEKTRAMQRTLLAEYFGLTFKDANVYMYLGSRESIDPDINDIQTKVFFEVPDRAYAENTINIPIWMDPMQETALDFSRFGIINPLGDEQIFRVHVDEFEKCLSRPLIVGDVLEIPFFGQKCKKAFWEVTDVDDKPSYEKFFYTIRATVLSDSRETREIPVDNGNDSFLDQVVTEVDTEHQEQVPYKGFDDPGVPEDVDYRDETQSSFLDDPTKVFGDE